MRNILLVVAWVTGLVFSATTAKGGDGSVFTLGDRMLSELFHSEVQAIEKRAEYLPEWEVKRLEYRRELAEMLGLWPEPARTDLKATITGRVEHAEFTVERLAFQSVPGLYVTGDVYVPRNLTGRAPAILYVCGHGEVKENGVSLGNKVAYQHHGEWFARNGYVCLLIDTLQLGEITGIHHGTYREGMWWWHARGYTPAGIEAWNSIRAIDYLCGRDDVDANRIGMTGRSGGGAYTWYTAALDERVKVAAPVAGITDLRNHVIDGCIEGHCDCMFMVNTYRWDFWRVAALVAPRPLLIGNSDKDTIFPLDGVMRVHSHVRDVYRIYGAEKNLGLLITEGPHKDTQDLQVPVFRWFNRFLKHDEGAVDKVAAPLIKPRELKVFDRLPADSINARVQETFVPAAAAPTIPESLDQWTAQRDAWKAALRAKTLAAWPEPAPAVERREGFDVVRNGIRLRRIDFRVREDIDVLLNLYVAQDPTAPALREVILRVLDEGDWEPWLVQMRGGGFDDVLTGDAQGAADALRFARVTEAVKGRAVAVAWFAPRGVGPTAWTTDPKKRIQILRRFALLGVTLDGMRVWDVRRAVAAVRGIPGLERLPVRLRARGPMAGVAVYASVFEPGVKWQELAALPRSHMGGPYLLNVLKSLDLDAALAMAAERAELKLYESAPSDRRYPRAVAEKLGWGVDRIQSLKDDAPTRWP